MAGVIKVVVSGGVGMGKSTAVANLTGASVETGDDMCGVTKKIDGFQLELNGVDGKIEILDAPGIGDQDVPPGELVKQYQDKLKDEHVHCVLLFMRADMPRFDLAAQILVALMNIAFPDKGADKWKNFIVVGTHKDLCSEGKLTKFRTLDESKGSLLTCLKSVVPDASLTAENICAISKDNVDELRSALIASFRRDGVGGYKIPTPAAFIRAVAPVMGINEKELATNMSADPAWKAMLESMQEQVKDLKSCMDKKDEMIMQLLSEKNSAPTVVTEHVPIPLCVVQ